MNYEEGIRHFGQLIGRGRTTFAELEETVSGVTYRGYGFSVADDHDEPDAATGDLLALGRAHADIGSQLKQAGWARVRAADLQRRVDEARYFLAGAGVLDEDAEPGPKAVGTAVVRIVADTSQFDDALERVREGAEQLAYSSGRRFGRLSLLRRIADFFDVGGGPR